MKAGEADQSRFRYQFGACLGVVHGRSFDHCGVMDQGVVYNHEDLAANMWINEKELNGASGVDDDGNGYADDIYGYNS